MSCRRERPTRRGTEGGLCHQSPENGGPSPTLLRKRSPAQTKPCPPPCSGPGRDTPVAQPSGETTADARLLADLGAGAPTQPSLGPWPTETELAKASALALQVLSESVTQQRSTNTRRDVRCSLLPSHCDGHATHTLRCKSSWHSTSQVGRPRHG